MRTSSFLIEIGEPKLPAIGINPGRPLARFAKLRIVDAALDQLVRQEIGPEDFVPVRIHWTVALRGELYSLWLLHSPTDPRPSGPAWW